MTEVLDKRKKQDLGIYYTPGPVVDFIYDILNILKKKEDKESERWESRKPRPHYPSVIDPACGEGVFLKKAIESGFTGYHPTYKAPYIFGVDIDETVVEQWERLSILSLFKGNQEMMKNHFFWQNSLVSLPDRKLPYKKSEDGLIRFDAVVGNPPYGGIGIDLKRKRTPEAIQLLEALQKYEIIAAKNKKAVTINESQTAISLPMTYYRTASIQLSPMDVAGKADSIPIEILFVERFIQLAKPGGWIAIIIPDGILANSNLHYVREFIAKKTKVLAIVSLPRDTFKQVGTSAKTSILFLQKYRDDDKVDMGYPVFLASINKLEKEYFNEISNSFNNFYNYGKL